MSRNYWGKVTHFAFVNLSFFFLFFCYMETSLQLIRIYWISLCLIISKIKHLSIIRFFFLCNSFHLKIKSCFVQNMKWYFIAEWYQSIKTAEAPWGAEHFPPRCSHLWECWGSPWQGAPSQFEVTQCCLTATQLEGSREYSSITAEPDFPRCINVHWRNQW